MSTVFERPEIRVDGQQKVTGSARFAADVARPGMLQAAFVQSPYPHARIVGVDTTAARRMAGVHAVLTGEDARGARFGRALQDWPVLCWDTVRFVGDRVAAVAAETRAIADKAARAVVVEYEELPAILDPDAALAPGAAVLHPDASEYAYLFGTRVPVPHPNVQGHLRHEHGDVRAGFAAAAHVFEHEFEVPRMFQGYLEPRACLVWLEGDVVHVITTNKTPFSLRDQLASTVGVPKERVIIDAGNIGGDFGGKGLSVEENALYFLAKASGRPVRSVMRFTDDLCTTTVRHAARIRLRTGVTAEGLILAHEAHVLFDGGAYAAGKPVPTLQPADALGTISGYHVPSALVEATTVYTNTVPAGHNRAPGQSQNTFAAESHLDLIARDLGIDPLALRERNAIHAGQVDVEGDRWAGSQMPRVLATLRRESDWDAPREPGIGRGCALGTRFGGTGRSSARLVVYPDGAVEVHTGVADQGSGAYTVFQRIVATELGMPLERVRVRRTSTSDAPVDPGIGGSRVTPVQGGAVLDAARKLKALLDQGESGPLEVEGSSVREERVFATYAYVVTVRVDPETGRVEVLDVLLVADTGTMINPVSLRGQLRGGFVFGFGQSVMEELVLEDGRVTVPNLSDYKLPSVADVPPMRIITLTDEAGPGPFGAKSVGELTNPAVAPAIANAVADAIGARVMSLPISAERIFDLRGSGRG